MFNRYSNSSKVLNNSELYKSLFRQKNISNIKQYGTFNFSNLSDVENNNSLTVVLHTVKPFEKLYMISQNYYKSPEYGWIILYTNKISNELLVKEGALLNIYFPLNELLGLL